MDSCQCKYIHSKTISTTLWEKNTYHYSKTNQCLPDLWLVVMWCEMGMGAGAGESGFSSTTQISMFSSSPSLMSSSPCDVMLVLRPEWLLLPPGVWCGWSPEVVAELSCRLPELWGSVFSLLKQVVWKLLKPRSHDSKFLSPLLTIW